jgi:PAS domain S-box-containing protein
VYSNEKLGWAAVVGVVGVCAGAVPVFDMADDIAMGQPPLTTVVENSPLIVLSLAVVAAGGWLATSDWDVTYVRTAAQITAAAVVGTAVVVTVVVTVQQQLQNNLKPLIIAADAVVIGALIGVALGVRSGQQQRATDEVIAQRDRFQALFDNVPNPIVGVEFVDDAPIVRAVNPAFTDVFGFDRETVLGGDLEQYIVPDDENLDPVDQPASAGIAARDPDAWDSNVIELETVDGRREFIRLTAPIDRGPARDGYAIYIDVTVQRQRRERLRVLSRTLRHDIRNQLNVIYGVDHLTDQLDDEYRKQAEAAVDAAEELFKMSEQTRRIEQQIAGGSQPQPHDLTALARRVGATVRSEFPDASIDVTAPGPLQGDVTPAFEDALEGVVRNGVEHNDRAEPTVEVTLAESLGGDYVDVRVADDGPGIDPRQVDIAEGHDRPDQKTNHLDGLGLWTARWVIQNSGGDLSFGSNSPRGTIVTLRVPSASDSPTDPTSIAT